LVRLVFRCFLVQVVEDDSLPLKLAFVAEIDKIAHRHSRHTHVIEELSVHVYRDDAILGSAVRGAALFAVFLK